jgi:hypothetical protein
MKPLIAALLAALTMILPPGRARAENATNTKPAAASDSGLSPLAEKYALKREALLKEFAAKRRVLIESAGWKTLSPAKQKDELEALAAEAKARDDKLIADYDAELRQTRTRNDADAASAQQERQRQLDELKTRAAQDALRAKKAP